MFKKLFGKKSQPMPKRPELPTDFETLQEMAVNHTQALMAAHSQSWGLGQALHWDVDLAAGTIMWVLADGKIARAPAQLIATWSSSENSFLWGWDHPSAPEGTAVAAGTLKRHAEAHDIAQLLERKVECSMDDGWQLAAMAVLAGDLQGVYRGQASETAWAYIGFGKVTLTKT